MIYICIDVDGIGSNSYIWRALKLDIHILQESPTNLDIGEQNCSKLFELEELALTGKLSGSMTFNPIGLTEWYVSGQVFGQQELTCVRTLEIFQKSFTVHLNVMLEIVNSRAEQEFDDSDEQIFRIKICPDANQSIDFTECLRQLIALEQPLYPVKNPDAEFKWEKNSEDVADEESVIDPRWAKLKEFKLDNKD